jgi:hypothetical protein
MYLAMSDLYRARWSNDIHEEWMRNLQKDYPDLNRQKVERIRDLMNAHVVDCIVKGYESIIPHLILPDPSDRHVVAAAICCRADIIVTSNVKHFPNDILDPYGIQVQHPDKFLTDQINVAPSVVCAAAKRQRQSLKNPPMSVEEYLASLERQGLAQTVSSLREYSELI